MPSGLMKSLAKEHGLDVSTVERYWRECENSKGKRRGMGSVVNCVKRRCVYKEKQKKNK